MMEIYGETERNARSPPHVLAPQNRKSPTSLSIRGNIWTLAAQLARSNEGETWSPFHLQKLADFLVRP